MLGLSLKLMQWSILRNRLQIMIMILAVVGSLSSYVLLGTALNEMSETVVQVQRTDWPFDITFYRNFNEALFEKAISDLQNTEGIHHIESLVMQEVYLFSGKTGLLMLPDEESRIIMELDEGSLPEDENEIVIPSEIALARKLSIGDMITVIPTYPKAEVQEFKISGTLSSKQSVTRMPLVTESGMRTLLNSSMLPLTIAIQLDGKVDLDVVIENILELFPGQPITTHEEGYESAKQNLKLSDSLVMSLRTLILGITATSLAVLLYISQRNGSFQTGVLRAIGVKKAWLLLPAIFQTTFIFLFGFIVTVFFIPFVSQILGLTSSRSILLSNLFVDGGVYYVVSIFSALVINLQFLKTPIPGLMKDDW